MIYVNIAQTVDPSQPLTSSGFSAFTQACDFEEDQGIGNFDYVISQKSQLKARFFIAHSDQLVTFPGGALNSVGNIRGFDGPGGSAFTVFSLAHTYALSNALLNQARFGFVRTRTEMEANAPFKWSDVGVSEGEMNPRVLASFRNRFGVVATNEHAAAEMEQSKTRTHRARHKTRASLLSDQGLDAANHHRASGGGRRMFLTSPLIEQAIAQVCAFCSPQSGILSAIAIFQQFNGEGATKGSPS